MIWMRVVSVACFVTCMTMANKTIHAKFNKWGNDLIRKIRNK